MASDVAYACCDGACDPNPGRMGIGVAFFDDAGETLATIARDLGQGTNNRAEYAAVEAALDLARDRGWSQFELRTDSQLVVRQLLGDYAVNDESLQPIHRRVRAKANALGVRIVHIPREQNVVADALSKRALRPNVFGQHAAEVRAQAERALAHVARDPDLHRITVFTIAHVEREPDLVVDHLLKLRLGVSKYSRYPLDVARFDAGMIHGKAEIAALEATLSPRSPETQLKGLRWAARGLAPALVAAKLEIEKAATLPYRLKKGSAR